MKPLSLPMRAALRIMLENEEIAAEQRSSGHPVGDGSTWLSNRNAGVFISHGTADALYSRGLANVYSLLGTATLTDDGREAARVLNPLPCPSCQGLGCTCPGYCEMGGNTLPDHTCPTCEGTGQIERPVRRAT